MCLPPVGRAQVEAPAFADSLVPDEPDEPEEPDESDEPESLLPADDSLLLESEDDEPVLAPLDDARLSLR
jgi:hypothetical protein